jgi:hypothetical protein
MVVKTFSSTCLAEKFSSILNSQMMWEAQEMFDFISSNLILESIVFLLVKFILILELSN